MDLKMLAGFEFHLQAAGLRPQTVEIYSETARRVLSGSGVASSQT